MNEISNEFPSFEKYIDNWRINIVLKHEILGIWIFYLCFLTDVRHNNNYK